MCSPNPERETLETKVDFFPWHIGDIQPAKRIRDEDRTSRNRTAYEQSGDPRRHRLIAGLVADSPKGKGVAEQTESILSQIDSFLAMAGTDKTKLLSTNIWITDMAHFAEMNSVWDAWVSPGNTPARATVEAKLASPDYKVEIMVVAAR
jgi:enamine deaminase RidA (YjgF/YER057c/UK114 family)